PTLFRSSFTATAKSPIVAAGALFINKSPALPCSKANSTNSTAFSKDIKKRVIFGSVTVRGCLFLICCTNKGITDPREAITLPYLVRHTVVFFKSREAAIATFSIIALEIPIALIGYAALSVLKQITFFTPEVTAASITFCVPITLVCTACIGKNSQEGTCFKAAA